MSLPRGTIVVATLDPAAGHETIGGTLVGNEPGPDCGQALE